MIFRPRQARTTVDLLRASSWSRAAEHHSFHHRHGFRRRLIITCCSEIPSFLDLAWTALSDRLSSVAISRELRPATASDRNFASSASVQVGVPTSGRVIASPSPSARARPGGGWLRKESVCRSALLPTFRRYLEIHPSHEALSSASCRSPDDLFSA
jgi:hypothetical protein